ncbi:hypothetical protein [Lawsonibacter sp. OA9]|uniref:hypothetical protein n=1 Tax=Lawsonibacter sp. OA9 TaxID=2914163 RepID=UPI001F05F4EA|nr:hypothetical protein [Lawsonibacter sp. OA9]
MKKYKKCLCHDWLTNLQQNLVEEIILPFILFIVTAKGCLNNFPFFDIIGLLLCQGKENFDALPHSWEQVRSRRKYPGIDIL